MQLLLLEDRLPSASQAASQSCEKRDFTVLQKHFASVTLPAWSRIGNPQVPLSMYFDTARSR